jgi:hypothetical protein
MGQMTMGHVLGQSVAIEGLEKEKKSFGIAHGGPKNVPDGHLRPRSRMKFIPEGHFFIVDCFKTPPTKKCLYAYAPSIYMGVTNTSYVVSLPPSTIPMSDWSLDFRWAPPSQQSKT